MYWNTTGQSRKRNWPKINRNMRCIEIMNAPVAAGECIRLIETWDVLK